MGRAREIWSSAKSARTSLAELYLRIRGIMIPIPASLRSELRASHPNGEAVPAMLAAIVREGEITAVQRTFLKLDQIGKAVLQPSKLCIGVVRGGTVRLAPAAETLVLCEGIETGLSVLQAMGLPVWAALGAGNLAHVVLPDIVHKVIIAADNDVNAVGQRAAYRAADRFITQGREVRIAIPSEVGQDFNDYLREGGAA
jgi:Toprim domain